VLAWGSGSRVAWQSRWESCFNGWGVGVNAVSSRLTGSLAFEMLGVFSALDERD